MRHISDAGLEFIKQREGLRLRLYKDTAGIWTIGYGHAIFVATDTSFRPATHDEALNFFPGGTITTARAGELLREDLKDAETAVSKVRVELDEKEFDALVSFVFNVGATAFLGSTLRKRIESPVAYDNSVFRSEFRRWKYAGGKESAGLLNRRDMEADLYLNGRYSPSQERTA